MFYGFKIEKMVDDIVDWIREWFEQNGKDCNAVIGISGGKDSTISAALCVKALGKDRVIGVLMPNGEQKDLDDAKCVVDCLGIRSVICNIKTAVDAVLNSLTMTGVEPSEQALINLPPRIRMSTLYTVSQSNNGRVINTCNLSEDVCGYSTIYGDYAGDVAIIDAFTVTELLMIGHYLCKDLGLPDRLIDKSPADGLTGKSDEEILGFTYEVLDHYIRTGECDDVSAWEKIKARRDASLFKRGLIDIPYFDPGIRSWI